MTYPRTSIEHKKLLDGQRVYVKDLDVFGRYRMNGHVIVCEEPMLGYVHVFKHDSVLYEDAIGDRDPQ